MFHIRWKWFFGGLISAAIMVLLLYVIAAFVWSWAASHPRRSPLKNIPAGNYEAVSFATLNGLTIQGWYIPSENRAAVIVLHGFNGNRESHLDSGLALARHGYGVLCIDLIGHGESDGELLNLTGEDVLAAVQYLQGRDEVDPTRIGVLGFSLGAFVAIQAAAQTSDIRAVVADGPFPLVTSEDTPPPESLKEWLWVPFDWFKFAALRVQGVDVPRSMIDTLPKIAPRPLLLIAGARSRTERRVLREYYDAALDPKTLWEVPEAGHVGAWDARPEEYEQRIIAFFAATLLDG